MNLKRNRKTQVMGKTLKDLSFFGHMDELRNRLIKSAVAVVISAGIVSIYIDEILEFIIKPVGKLVFTSPTDAFVAQIILIFLGGFLLALPVVLYQAWCFLATGLKEQERTYIAIFAPFSILLFIVGALFAYTVAIPISFQFLLGFSSEYIVPMITIKSYISFVGTMILAFGVIFELPIVLIFLTKIGIATPAFLEQKRKHAIVLIFIMSALITPPDIITQVILSVPLIVLYEIGIICSKMVSLSKNVSKTV